MNCKQCQKEMDASRQGLTTGDMMTQVESHLKMCASCADIYMMYEVAEKVFKAEKETEPDPFIVTRVMASIGKQQYKNETGLIRIAGPALLSLSAAAAVFIGIIIGNLSLPAGTNEKIPVELALINDASLESVETLSNE